MTKQDLLKMINNDKDLKDPFNADQLLFKFIAELDDNLEDVTKDILMYLVVLSYHYQSLLVAINSVCTEQEMYSIAKEAGFLDEVPEGYDPRTDNSVKDYDDNTINTSSDELDDVDDKIIFDFFNAPISEITS